MRGLVLIAPLIGLLLMAVGSVTTVRAGWNVVGNVLLVVGGLTVAVSRPRDVMRGWVPYQPWLGLVLAVVGAGLVVVGSFGFALALLIIGLWMLVVWQMGATPRAWERYVMPLLWLALCATAGVASRAGLDDLDVGGLLAIGGIGGALVTAGAFDRRFTVDGGALVWGPFRPS
jgi:hypothetical protein